MNCVVLESMRTGSVEKRGANAESGRWRFVHHCVPSWVWASSDDTCRRLWAGTAQWVPVCGHTHGNVPFACSMTDGQNRTVRMQI